MILVLCHRLQAYLIIAGIQVYTAKYEDIEEEHGELIRWYHAEENLNLAIDVCDHNTSFRNGWDLIGSRFPALFEFA